jgi:hypothetical protein
MNAKHTPGPWEVDRFYWTIQRRMFGPDEPEVEVIGRLTNGEEAEANARLIAAAPELLKALQMLSDAAGRVAQGAGVIDERGFNTLAHSVSIALAAIAKATNG